MERNYLNLLKRLVDVGAYKEPARPNMPGTYSLFGEQLRFNLQYGFPLLTTKKIDFHNIATELCWMLHGDTNIKYLVDRGVNIWNEDAYRYYLKVGRENNLPIYSDKSLEEFVADIKDDDTFSLVDGYRLGDCGNIYGKNWRNWGLGTYYYNNLEITRDQIQILIDGLIHNPSSRRHVLSSWNVGTMEDAALPACHTMAQFNCRPLSDQERVFMTFNNNLVVKHQWDLPGGWSTLSWEGDRMEVVNSLGVPKYYLDCHMYQRSADFFLGAPYNIASYALLTHIIADYCNMEVGDLIISYGDVHLYENHLEAAAIQLEREPQALPKLRFEKLPSVDELQPEMFSVEDYNHHPRIVAKLSTGL